MGRLPFRVLALGVASIVIAVTGVAIATGRLEPKEPAPTPVASPPGPREEPFHALWPERTRPKAEAAQAAADGGTGPEWRLDAQLTAELFAKRLMGWEGVRSSVAGCIASCLSNEDRIGFALSPGCPPFECGGLNVRVERLVRTGTGGIWSVTAVASEFQLNVEAGELVSAGDEISANSRGESAFGPLAEGTPVQSGYFVGGPCGIGNQGVGSVEDGRAEVFVDDFVINECASDETADGYVAAWRTDLEDLQPDPLSAPLAGRRLRLTAFAAVPVAFGATPITVEESDRQEAAEFAREFMQARLRGADVDAMLSRAARGTYASPPNSLNLAPARGVRYRFQMRDVARPEGAQGYSVIVVLFRHYEGEPIPVRSVEQLFLQAGFNSEGEQLPLVIRQGGSYFGGYIKNACLHGGVCWGVYLAVGPHDDANVRAQADRLRQLGFESYPGAYGVAGPGSEAYPGSAFWSVAAGGLGADAGAIEALGVGQDSDVAVVYFTSEETARAFVGQLDPPPIAIVRIVIFGAD